MSLDIYQKLARHLDKLPGGFPPTNTGIELRILRRLFTPEQADLATKLTLIPEKIKVIARRAKLSIAECDYLLETMSSNGLIFSYNQYGYKYYMAANFVIGIWEYQVNRLSPELIIDMRQYIPTLFNFDIWGEVPQLRTIPVDRSLSVELNIMPYEKAEEIINFQKHILVAPCICRKEHKIMGEKCNRPEESCLIFGVGVQYYQANKLGRVIKQGEALEILKKADEAGLVLQPSNAEQPINICCCCGCCCNVLKNLKSYPRPAEIVSSPFLAKFNIDACLSCGICKERCQMQAISQPKKGEGVFLDLERCIGCGLCVTTCSGNALKLVRRSKQRQLPKNIVENYLNLGKIRGKIRPHNLVWMRLKSKLDRLLAKS